MKSLFRLFFCIVLAMLATAVYAQDRQLGEAQYEEGKKYNKAGDYDNAIRCYKAAAELGYADAMGELADIYKDEKKDNVQALIWYKKYLSAIDDAIAKKGTIEQDDSLSIHCIYSYIGEIYKEGGNGVERDLAQAVRCYEKAINYGASHWSYAIYLIAEKYLYGDEEEGIKEDNQQALILLNKAYNYGCRLAAFDLGECYLNGWGVEKDEKAAFNYYKEAVGEEEEHVRAMAQLGLCYYDGKGTERDLTKAAYYMSKAAEKGYPPSQRNLAFYYLQNVKNMEMAFSWLKKSAEADYGLAQYELGYFYENGIGTVTDDMQAAKWYQEAAEKGLASAQNNLAMMYYKGKGVEQSYELAATWARKSSEKGDAVAQFNLGEFYEDGKGVEQDLKQAFYWYKKAAEQDDAEACWRVCRMYYEGRGVKKDTMEWYNWRKKAAQLGHKVAQREIEMFENAKARQNAGH